MWNLLLHFSSLFVEYSRWSQTNICLKRLTNKSWEEWIKVTIHLFFFFSPFARVSSLLPLHVFHLSSLLSCMLTSWSWHIEQVSLFWIGIETSNLGKVVMFYLKQICCTNKIGEARLRNVEYDRERKTISIESRQGKRIRIHTKKSLPFQKLKKICCIQFCTH